MGDAEDSGTLSRRQNRLEKLRRLKEQQQSSQRESSPATIPTALSIPSDGSGQGVGGDTQRPFSSTSGSSLRSRRKGDTEKRDTVGSSRPPSTPMGQDVNDRTSRLLNTSLAGFGGKVNVQGPSDGLTAEQPSCFLLMANGEVESGDFPNFDNLYCKYSYSYGPDWQVKEGLEHGLTQISRKAPNGSHVVVWNFPVDVTFKSTNAYGWPQLNLSVYSIDSLGRDLVRGYGSVHIPLGVGRYTLYVRMFTPSSSSKLQQLTAFLTGMPPEFIDPKFTSKGEGREVTRVSSHGVVKVVLNVMTTHIEAFGFSKPTGVSKVYE